MRSTTNEMIDVLPNPFSQDDYHELLSRLELDARTASTSLGLDWAANMEELSDCHSLDKQALTVLKLGLFDEDYYLSTYPDVAMGNIAPLLHYVNFGDREGRWPNPVFDPNFYRTHFAADSLQSVAALYHYAVLGEAIGLNASKVFSPKRYLFSNTGLHPWVDRPLTHFLHFGRACRLAINQRIKLDSTQKICIGKVPQPLLPTIVNPARGINVIGPLDKVSGLGVSARGYLAGLSAAGMTALGSRAQQKEFAIQKKIRGAFTPPYIDAAAINIFHMNGDTLPIMMKDGGEALFRDTYNVAVWYWELPTLRPEWQASMKYFHEFWAPTPFIASALRQSTAKPVRLIPPYLSYLLNLPSPPKPATDITHFVYCFDANSILERKNPGALLDAFRKAFPKDSMHPPVRLTFKITYPNRKIIEVDQLYEAAKQDSRIKIIDQLLSDAELHLLIGSATAYVSPHRSEGLGLTVIEAMGAGVPVIATPFGGVDTFVTPDAAFPIDFGYVELEDDYIPYPRGFVWADPDPESLAVQLGFVQKNPDVSRKRAQVARQRVIDFFCSPALIQTYQAEIQRISHLC